MLLSRERNLNYHPARWAVGPEPDSLPEAPRPGTRVGIGTVEATSADPEKRCRDLLTRGAVSHRELRVSHSTPPGIA